MTTLLKRNLSTKNIEDKNYDKDKKILFNKILPIIKNVLYIPINLKIINSKKIGYYTDMWSAICILFLCFTDNTPFNDKTEYLIFQNISNINSWEESNS